MTYSTIALRELDQWIEFGQNMVIVDLRKGNSYRQCHIRGAINLPYESIEERFGELPKDKTLIFYCGRGGQSMRVCQFLSDMGYRTVNVACGIVHYRGKYLESL